MGCIVLIIFAFVVIGVSVDEPSCTLHRFSPTSASIADFLVRYLIHDAEPLRSRGRQKELTTLHFDWFVRVARVEARICRLGLTLCRGLRFRLTWDSKPMSAGILSLRGKRGWSFSALASQNQKHDTRFKVLQRLRHRTRTLSLHRTAQMPAPCIYPLGGYYSNPCVNINTTPRTITGYLRSPMFSDG